MTIRFGLALAILVALTACRKDETVAGYGGAGKVWRLVELDDATYPYDVTLTFPERGLVAGKAPCNRYSAEMDIPYPWFGVGPIRSTHATCPEQAVENAYLGALKTMTLSEVLGNTLILRTDDGREMVFKSTD